MRIVVKEIDRFLSSRNKGRYISEYLLYFKMDEVSVECFNEIGVEAKELRLNELVKKYNCDKIEEITFEEFKKTI